MSWAGGPGRLFLTEPDDGCDTGEASGSWALTGGSGSQKLGVGGGLWHGQRVEAKGYPFYAPYARARARARGNSSDGWSRRLFLTELAHGCDTREAVGSWSTADRLEPHPRMGSMSRRRSP